MNELFSLKRFLNVFRILLKSHLIPCAIIMMISLAIITGINILILLYSEPGLGRMTANIVALIISFFLMTIVLPLIASRSFKEYFQRPSATQLLMLPASRLEKFSSLYLIYVILVPIILNTSTLVIENAFLIHSTQEVLELYKNSPELAEVVSQNSPFTIEDVKAGSFISLKGYASTAVLFAMIQSFFMLGSSIFKTHPFIKTNLSCLGLFILFIILSTNDAFKNVIENIDLDTLTSYPTLINLVLTVIFTTLTWLRYKKINLV